MSLGAGTRLGPYEILGLIGAGGMGEVYKAQDTRLGRTVAIKVLPAQYGDLEHRARFELEARAIATLSHPHICTLHDVGEHAGTMFLVMEHLAGETLAQRLEKGPLPAGEALAIASEIADALDKAHQQGIVHRDLKPANVMLTAGGVKLLDFGLAKLQQPEGVGGLSAAVTMSGQTPTIQGTVLGTPQYMSPEQLAGDGATWRSDVWAFGCVLYEMLTGKRAFDLSRGDEISAVRPRRAARVIRTCLERDPSARSLSMAEISTILRGRSGRLLSRSLLKWTAVAVVSLAAVAGGFVVLRNLSGRSAAPPKPQTVLVADFKNTTGEPLFDGVLEGAMSVALESSSFISVYARRDALGVAAQIGHFTSLDDTAARLVAQREGIPVLVTGTIAAARNGYDISAALVDAVSGAPLAVTTEKDLEKSRVLSAVARISDTMRQSLGDSLTISNSELARETFTTSSLDAAHAYAAAQALAASGKDDDAVEQYQQAVRIDPEFGRAYAGWALSAGKLGRAKQAEELFEKAITLLSRMNRRERLRTEGLYAAQVRQDYARAAEIYRALVAEFPADPSGPNNLAVSEFMLGRFAEAYEQGLRVVSMSPNHLLGRENLSLYALYAGRFDVAAEQAQAAIRLSNGAVSAYIPLAVTAAIKGEYDKAAGWYTSMARTGRRGAWWSELGLADLEIASGRPRDAEQRLLRRIPEDERAQNTTAVAYEYAMLAEVAADRHRPSDVARYVTRGRAASTDPKFTYQFALSLLDSGRYNDARRLVLELGRETRASAAGFHNVLEKEIAARNGGPPGAILGAAREEGVFWAYYRAATVLSRTRAPEAIDAIRWCIDHRSQAVSAFLDDIPTVRYYVAAGALGKPR